MSTTPICPTCHGKMHQTGVVTKDGHKWLVYSCCYKHTPVKTTNH